MSPTTKLGLMHIILRSLLICAVVSYVVNADATPLPSKTLATIAERVTYPEQNIFRYLVDFEGSVSTKIDLVSSSNSSVQPFCELWNPILTDTAEVYHSAESDRVTTLKIGSKWATLDLNTLTISLYTVSSHSPQIVFNTKFTTENKKLLTVGDTVFLLVAKPDAEMSYFLTIVDNYVIVKTVTGLSSGKAVTQVSETFKALKKTANISHVYLEGKYLYVCAEKEGLQIYNVDDVLSSTDFINPVKTFSKDEFSTTLFNITQITVQGNTAFVLDSMRGVWLINIETFRLNSQRVDIFGGQHIAVKKNTLIIITAEPDTRYVEYFFNPEAPANSLVNREVELWNAVSAVAVNNQYAFLISDASFEIFMHSIDRHHVPELDRIIIMTRGEEIQVTDYEDFTVVTTVHADELTATYVSTVTPELVCAPPSDLPKGSYTYVISSVIVNTTTFEPYQLTQKIKIDVAYNIFQSEKNAVAAGFGTGLILGCIFIFCAALALLKYRRQISTLQDRIKFLELPQQATGPTSASGHGNFGRDNWRKLADSSQSASPDKPDHAPDQTLDLSVVPHIGNVLNDSVMGDKF